MRGTPGGRGGARAARTAAEAATHTQCGHRYRAILLASFFSLPTPHVLIHRNTTRVGLAVPRGGEVLAALVERRGFGTAAAEPAVALALDTLQTGTLAGNAVLLLLRVFLLPTIKSQSRNNHQHLRLIYHWRSALMVTHPDSCLRNSPFCTKPSTSTASNSW